jgi:hypothetical protein
MTMNRYAENTSVACEKSRADIERVLVRYGATGFMYGWQKNIAVVGFEMSDRTIRFNLPMPDKKDERFIVTETGRDRSEVAAHKAWEQAGRQAWRALLLVVKAKLEAVEADITTFDNEFMAHIVMPDGKTLGEHIVPQIAVAYKTKKMPKLLPQYVAG